MEKVKPAFIKHIGIIVSNMERSIDFYCDTLGFELEATVELIAGDTVEKGVGIPGAAIKSTYMKLGEGSTMIELLQYLNPKSKPIPPDAKSNDIGVGHAAFYVEEIESYYEMLVKKGVKFISPGVMESSTGARFCYFYDPDGAVLEIIKPPEGPLKSVDITSY